MHVIEVAITEEESRNYHKLQYQIKALRLSDWVRAYIRSVIYVMIICLVCYISSKGMFLYLWMNIPMIIKICIFICLFFISAVQRSRSMQMKAMLVKYFLNNIPYEFKEGKAKLKKIKIQGNKLLFFYNDMN